jgi:hypothetical protein
MALRTCENCGRQFEAVRSSRRFCSASCRVNAHQKGKRKGLDTNFTLPEVPMSQPTSKLLTAAQAARIRGVHPKTFARWKIPPVVPGRRGRGGEALYDPATVKAFQPPEPGRPGRVVPPSPLEPKPVDCPLPDGIEAQIVAGLELGARTHRSPKWLDHVADKWLAETSKLDPNSRRGIVRERDIAEKDPRVTQDGEILPLRGHVKTSTSDDWKPLKGVKMTAEERAARRKYLSELDAIEGHHAWAKGRDVKAPHHDSHDTAS